MCRCKHDFPGLSLVLLCALTLLPVQAGGETAGPAQVITRFNATLIEAMKGGKDLGFDGRYRLLEPVVKETFSLPYMASVSVGKHWKTLAESQRRQLEQVYAEWSIAHYAKNFDEYKGERFEITGQSQTAGGVTVLSTLANPGGKQTDFEYRLRRTEGAWRVVDIRVSGVSQLANTRAQFVSVLDQKGFDGLMATLKRKIREFSRTAGR